jgi:formylglycine-generating enzyme required for sulfatase activity
VAWYDGNSGDKTHLAGTKKANELGIYDMSGNVREWCNDRYGAYGSSAQTNSVGAPSGSYRVNRSGYRDRYTSGFRVVARSYNLPNSGYYNHGFCFACSSK